MNNRMYGALMGHIDARLYLDDKYFLAIKDRELAHEFAAYFGNVQIIDSPSEFETIANRESTQKSIYYADSLLLPMRRANVTHIILANLRLNPNIKDGQIINTVERMASFVQEKYPRIFEKVKQIGADDDEPAQIYQINWDSNFTSY